MLSTINTSKKDNLYMIYDEDKKRIYADGIMDTFQYDIIKM